MVCISDRQDYYHQLRVSPERAASNTLWPPLPTHLLHSTRAFDVLADSLASKKKKRGPREEIGDGLAAAAAAEGSSGGRNNVIKEDQQLYMHVSTQ